jgi:hypothetical protein
VVLEARGHRRKAQAAVLAKLNGKVSVNDPAKDKSTVPVAAFNYTSPRPSEPRQCRGGAKIPRSTVVNQKYVFHNAGGYSYSHMVRRCRC